MKKSKANYWQTKKQVSYTPKKSFQRYVAPTKKDNSGKVISVFPPCEPPCDTGCGACDD